MDKNEYLVSFNYIISYLSVQFQGIKIFFPFLKNISLIRRSLHSCDTMVVFAIHVDGWHDGMMDGMMARWVACPLT